MHNLAIALCQNGHLVSGSDDEIYEPARSRLAANGILPTKDGWDAARITPDLDMVVLGMHARKDNPELLRALELGLSVRSFPEFIYQHAEAKTRIVVAGSHGKTTTTAMIMHVFKACGIDFDYLVGASLEGFDTMVRLSDAPVMVIEGDEYLSSCLDPQPKFLHYLPDIAIVTGIAWDHINVFPKFEDYVDQFRTFISTIHNNGTLIFYKKDPHLLRLVSVGSVPNKILSYDTPPHFVQEGRFFLYDQKGGPLPLQVIGRHNLQNLEAAGIACFSYGIAHNDFLAAIASFKGAAKRLQLLASNGNCTVFLDFAHAPSKVQATVEAVSNSHPGRDLVACLELHTFSSLNKDFLPQYAKTMNAAQQAIVYFDPHTLAMKRMPALTEETVERAFEHPALEVVTTAEALAAILGGMAWNERNLLLMSSGKFGGLDVQAVARQATA
jgi:UDP-N-acetylmuramate: L-alanyl-gamma-D-glutamyl-meso-diaminopimelate ligase